MHNKYNLILKNLGLRGLRGVRKYKNNTLVLIIIGLLVISAVYGYSYYINHTKGNIYKCYTDVMSKKEKQYLLELVNIWTTVSERVGIRWSVCAGTYMGLRRNNKQIPWDDDFDVTIVKEDLPKFQNIDKILAKYNVGIVWFEHLKAYKLFYTDHRGKKMYDENGGLKKYTWPFIDVFASDNDKECSFVTKEEMPLKKELFEDTSVYVYQNPNQKRKCISNTVWENEYYDVGYRHQLENSTVECKAKPVMS